MPKAKSNTSTKSKAKPKSKAAQAKASMKCGQVKKSNKPQKKVMKKVCSGGSEKMIYAGDSRYTSNKTPAQKKNFRKRQKCSTAKKDTPKDLACKELWPTSGGKTIRGTSPEKRKLAKTGTKKKTKTRKKK